jgi:hypothetical protein
MVQEYVSRTIPVCKLYLFAQSIHLVRAIADAAAVIPVATLVVFSSKPITPYRNLL